MEQTATNTAIACPLPCAAALRRNLRAPRGDLRAQCAAWLYWHCWRHVRGAWQDPLDLDRRSFEFAICAQTTREAQVALGQRGYVMTGGSVWAEGLWSVDTFEVCKTGHAGYFTVSAALKREGFSFMPAIAPIITRPRLQLVYGGRSA